MGEEGGCPIEGPPWGPWEDSEPGGGGADKNVRHKEGELRRLWAFRIQRTQVGVMRSDEKPKRSGPT